MSLSDETRMPSKYGDFYMRSFSSHHIDFPHIVIYTKKYYLKSVIDTRIHSECMTGDVFSSLRCDCGEQLQMALKWIGHYGGILIYLRQEGRGIGLENKLKAYNLQDQGYDTIEANVHLGYEPDLRNYQLAVQVLKKMGANRIRLLTNNPDKLDSFKNSEIEVVERIPLEVVPESNNRYYLQTKKKMMGHLLSKINNSL